MVKRLLSATSSEIKKMTPMELKQAIKSSEGRIICSENVALSQSVAGDITNAELASAYGADLILLNGFDVFNPIVMGLPGSSNLQEMITLTNDPRGLKKNPVNQLKHLTGKPIGISLKPVGYKELGKLSNGDKCTKETLQEAQKLGFDFIYLAENSNTEITNKNISESIRLAKKYFYGLIIAGKMNVSKGDEKAINIHAVKSFVEEGADVVLIPSVGTVQGVSDEEHRDVVRFIHSQGALAMSSIRPNQESSDQEMIKQLATRNKLCGVDIQHIGESGDRGLAPVESIYAMSIVIRGLRHTMNRMGTSINR